jgi:hypothetical protein
MLIQLRGTVHDRRIVRRMRLALAALGFATLAAGPSLSQPAVSKPTPQYLKGPLKRLFGREENRHELV